MEADVLTRPCGPAGTAATPVDVARIRRIIADHYGFLWRSLRRLGVPEADVDDGAQRVLGVVVRRLPEIAGGAERAFLFQTAVRVASEMRRAARRSRLSLEPVGDERIDERPGPEEALEQQRARALLAEVLDALDLDLCSVFVLFEIEEMTTAEIAELLAIPPGTVSSRLKRAREEFRKIADRLKARHATERRRP